MKNNKTNGPFKITADWIKWGLAIIWIAFMTYMQSKFVTNESFKEATKEVAENMTGLNEKMIAVDTTLKVQTARFSLVEDHELRIRVLEQKVIALEARRAGVVLP